MGKRAKKVTLKKMAKPKLETVFSCPLCSHEKCIECRMDRQQQIGTAKCRVCSAGYQTVITYLSDPVDVYGEWVDVISERENKGSGSVSVTGVGATTGIGATGVIDDDTAGEALPRFNVTKRDDDDKDKNDYNISNDDDDDKSEFESIASESAMTESSEDNETPDDSSVTNDYNNNKSENERDSEDEKFEALISNMHKRGIPQKTAIVESSSSSDSE